MQEYLGEEVVADLSLTPYSGFTQQKWALEFIQRYGGIEGAHHKQWVLDQVTRILHGTGVIVSKASWGSGTSVSQVEYRIKTGEPSAEYRQWVIGMRRGDAKEGMADEYDYEEGTAP